MSRALLAVLVLLGGGAPFLSAPGMATIFRAVTAAVGSDNDPNGAPRTTVGNENDPNGGPQTDVGGENDPNG